MMAVAKNKFKKNIKDRPKLDHDELMQTLQQQLRELHVAQHAVMEYETTTTDETIDVESILAHRADEK